MLGLGVLLGVGVLVGVEVCEEVRELLGVGVVVGVAVGLAVREVVELKDAVLVELGVMEGEAVTLGVGVCVGEGVGRLQVAEEPEPAKIQPLVQMHVPPAPAAKPGEHVQAEAEPTEVAPVGHAVQRSPGTARAALLAKLSAHAHCSPPE